MKLKYYIEDNKKVYTLKDKIDNKQTIDAHYKFIKVRSIKENNQENS